MFAAADIKPSDVNSMLGGLPNGLGTLFWSSMCNICVMADGVTVGHSVTLIHVPHMMVIIHHNLQLYGFSSFITEITFRWGILNISQHAYISRPATVVPSSQP
jgi:hypothetical protein